MQANETSPKRIALVVQRYGESIIGGAESHARLIAERLAETYGLHIDVYTSCAKDYRTWRNEWSSGVEKVSPHITIKRFRTWFPRFQSLFHVYSRLFFKLQRHRHHVSNKIYAALEWLWFILQGPYCPGLVTHLKKHIDSYEKIILFTYLYYPTLAAARLDPRKNILIPTAHDEPPFYTDAVRHLLMNTPQILANTVPEKDLIQRFIGRSDHIQIAGIGIDFKPFESMLKEGDHQKPYVLYLGRISRGKHVPELINHFLAYLHATNDQKTRLILAGKKENDVQIPSHLQISYLGFIDENEKIKLISNSTCLINPSPFESLSMIVIEAMAAQIPVLVNQHCEVLRYYAESTDTVFTYSDEASFIKQLTRITTDAWDQDHQKKQSLCQTRNWAYEHFSWPKVLEVYHNSLHTAELSD
ncbi:MAG: glycosyltransferase family 4 protein [Oligoflexus sp.]